MNSIKIISNPLWYAKFITNLKLNSRKNLENSKFNLKIFVTKFFDLNKPFIRNMKHRNKHSCFMKLSISISIYFTKFLEIYTSRLLEYFLYSLLDCLHIGLLSVGDSHFYLLLFLSFTFIFLQNSVFKHIFPISLILYTLMLSILFCLDLLDIFLFLQISFYLQFLGSWGWPTKGWVFSMINTLYTCWIHNIELAEVN